MKVSVGWLREYVPFDLPVEEVARRLVVASCEVDRVVTRGVSDADGNLGKYLVGRVLEANRHPNADRLQVCLVDVGEPEPRQIVCGAWNFGAGATVAVALPGAVLPDGRTLSEIELRGEASSGMILAEDELELGTDHTGIMLLPDRLEPGTLLSDVLPLSEEVLEIETGFNRPDLTSVYGIAREVAAVCRVELGPPPGLDPRGGEEPVDVRIEDVEGCPRYMGRFFRDVSVGESPAWLQARLHAAGMRPISNVVDITNYVMLAFGSPLHAFDAARLAGGRIVVRRARAGEELTTLDGTMRKLAPTDLMIADAERSVAIAGIMGGSDSEVTAKTTDVLLEAANFEPLTILRSSRRLRLRSEASTRWEKGVDPELAEQAAVYATQLLVELTGARWTGSTDVKGELSERPVVRLRPERVDALLGLETPVEEQRETLAWLGFEVADDLTVTVPSWRARDVTRDVDLVEEVGRFRLDAVPGTLPVRRAMFGRLTREQRLRRLVEDVLVGAGWFEAYTWSLVPDDGSPDRVRLPEPLSAEQAVLRGDLRYGLLESARRNANAGNQEIRLFEVARVYRRAGQLPEERWHVAGVAEGGFPQAKGAVAALHEAVGVEPAYERGPGRSARIEAGVVEELDEGWGYFELDLETLTARMAELRVYEDVITFPGLKQDLAFAVDESVAAGDLIAAAREAAGPELRELRVFDVYRGEQVGERRKSIALAAVFQSPERTLSDADAAAIRNRIVRTLAKRFGAELRA